jgi:hypothetical protein
MRRSTTAAGLAGLALILAACSSGGDGEPAAAASEPVATAESAEEATEPAEHVEETAAPEKSADAACGAVMNTDLLERIPESINAIGPDLGGEQLDELLIINAELGLAIEVAPPEVAAPLRSIQVPFQTVNDAVAEGGGSLNIDTSGLAEDITSLMSECVDAGFTIDE